MERKWAHKPRDLSEGEVQRTFPGHARHRTRRFDAELVRVESLQNTELLRRASSLLHVAESLRTPTSRSILREELPRSVSRAAGASSAAYSVPTAAPAAAALHATYLPPRRSDSPLTHAVSKEDYNPVIAVKVI